MNIPYKKILFIFVLIILIFLVLHALLVFNGWENSRWLLIAFQNKFGFTYPLDKTHEMLFDKVNPRLNLDSETGIPTWFSTVLLYSIGLISLINAWIYRRWRPTALRAQKFWWISGALFLFLSLDEGAMIHEMLQFPPKIKWVYFYAPFLAAFFLYFANHLIRHRRNDRRLMSWYLGGLLLMGLGGVFFEYLEFIFGWEGNIEEIERLFEEGFEMLGACLVLLGGIYEFDQLSARLNLIPPAETLQD